jgi:hypothetical protein
VKPEYRAPHERALAFRNTLRELVKVKTVPDRVLAELRTCWQRNIWTSLLGSDGRLFKTFGDFCRDVRGLGCEPAPVEALLTELIGATAFALSATPVAQPGRRTDRHDPTSRRRGEKSRPSRTHTRHRTIHRGPPVLVQAVGCKVLGKMHAEFLAGYHQENPECARFAALMHQLEDGVAAQGKADRAAARTAISGEVQALKTALRRSPQGRSGRRKASGSPMAVPANEAGASGTTPSHQVAASTDSDAAEARPPVGASVRAGRSEACPRPPLLAPPSCIARADLPTSSDGPDLHALFLDLLRTWRRIVAHAGDGLDLPRWLEVLHCAASGECRDDDHTLFARLAPEDRGRPTAGLTATTALVGDPSGERAARGGDGAVEQLPSAAE